MTTPDIATINPSKSKTWVTIIGGAVSVIVPLALAMSTGLDPKWQAVITAVVWALTAAGVYKAPYKPEGTSVVSNADLREVANPVPPTPGQYQPPWPKP